MVKNKPKSLFANRLSQWAGPLLFLASLLYSISTLPRDLVWGDSPELAASAWVLGVPHPTGYSLYMLLARLFQALPAGTVIYRTHLFSALCSALTVWALYLFLRQCLQTVFPTRASLTIFPALIASAAWSLTPVVWSQSRITEVYALFALQFALALWLFTAAVRSPHKTIPLLAFLFGTMLVHHRLSIFIIAWIVLFLIYRLRRKAHKDESIDRQWKTTVWKSVLYLFVPLLLLAYFPIRAAFDPAVNWYDPDGFARFYALVSGQLYSGTLSQSLANLAQTNAYSVLTGFLSILILPLLCYNVLFIPIVSGAVVLIRRIPWLGVFSISLFVVYQIFVFLYRVGDWQVFLIPALTLLTVPLAFGLAGILHQMQEKGIAPSIVRFSCITFLAASVFPLWVRFDETQGILERPAFPGNYTVVNGAPGERIAAIRDSSASTYADRVWDQIPNGAPLLTGLAYETADNELYPLLYRQIVDGRNPDSPLVGAGFIHFDWYRKQIAPKLGIELPPKQDKLFETKEKWLKSVWEDIVAPLVKRGPVYTTSFSLTNPPPQAWMKKARFDYLGMIPIDRENGSALYAPYIPGGHLYKIGPKQTTNANTGNQP